MRESHGFACFNSISYLRSRDLDYSIESGEKSEGETGIKAGSYSLTVKPWFYVGISLEPMGVPLVHPSAHNDDVVFVCGILQLVVSSIRFLLLRFLFCIVAVEWNLILFVLTHVCFMDRVEIQYQHPVCQISDLLFLSPFDTVYSSNQILPAKKNWDTKMRKTVLWPKGG